MKIFLTSIKMDPLFAVDDDGFRTCPYNTNHRVFGFRFIGHVLKCSKSSGKRFRVCPWNATHHIVEPYDFQLHTQTCMQRENVDDFRDELAKKSIATNPLGFSSSLGSVYDDSDLKSKAFDITSYESPAIHRYRNEESSNWDNSVSDTTDDDADFFDYDSSTISDVSNVVTVKSNSIPPGTLSTPRPIMKNVISMQMMNLQN